MFGNFEGRARRSAENLIFWGHMVPLGPYGAVGAVGAVGPKDPTHNFRKISFSSAPKMDPKRASRNFYGGIHQMLALKTNYLCVIRVFLTQISVLGAHMGPCKG